MRAAERRYASGGSAISIRSTSLARRSSTQTAAPLCLFEATAPASSTLSAAGAAVWPRFASAGPVKAEKGARAALAGTTTAAAIYERPRDQLHAARQALTVIELQTSVEGFFAHDSRRNSERQAEPLDSGMTKTIACSRIELKHAVLRPDLEHPRARR